VLLLLCAGVGVDQILRAHPAGNFRGPAATAIYLFVPVLYTAAAALFLREQVTGAWSLPVSAVAAVFFTLAAHAEYITVEADPESYPQARFALNLVSYLAAFGLFTVVFTAGLPLAAATVIVAVTALLLTVDVLREMDVSLGALFAYAAAVAAILAELRCALYYLALDNALPGALLLVAFYVLTGVMQSYLSGHLDRRAVTEFCLIGAAGLLIVAAARIVSSVR
jgi:hypothetical protein